MGSKSSDMPAPDPKLIEAQLKSMGIQDDAIQSIIRTATELAPLQKQQMQFGIDTSKTAYEQSQQDRAWTLGRRDSLSTMQDTLIKDATSFNEAGKESELAGKAQADVTTAFDNVQEQNARAMARMGINPASMKTAALGNQTAIAKAAAMVGASNNARTGARLEGRALTDRATNALAGYPSMATAATGSGAGFGANGITLANTGLAGLNSGAMTAGSQAGAMGANATSMYGVQQTAKTAADGQAGEMMGSILGAGATVGAAFL